MAGSLSRANREIREAADRDEERRAARGSRPRQLTDLLLSQMEELNLDEIGRVPERYESELGELRELLAQWPRARERFGPRLQTGVKTADLIETIFAVQEVIAPPVTNAAMDANEVGEFDDLGWSLSSYGR